MLSSSVTWSSGRPGHKWGRISCAQGHRVSVWSTPRSPGNHARDLRKWAEQHAHSVGEQREASDDGVDVSTGPGRCRRRQR
jgi:hypothetical protein